jgi:hypothetical protein
VGIKRTRREDHSHYKGDHVRLDVTSRVFRDTKDTTKSGQEMAGRPEGQS